MTFAQMMGLPHEDEIPEDALEEYEETVGGMLEDALNTGVIRLTLTEWALLTNFERGVILAMSHEQDEEFAALEAALNRAMETAGQG